MDDHPRSPRLMGAEIAVISARLRRLQHQLEADQRERTRFARPDEADQRNPAEHPAREPRRFS